MVLFQRNTKRRTNEEPVDRFPAYVDALLSETESSDQALSGVENIDDPSNTRDNIRYGIEKAIKLIRKLPDEKSAEMVAIVRDTLESADINVDSIIADAQQQAAEVEQRITALSSEISDLQALISNKEQEIMASKDILDETHKVKLLLETAESTNNHALSNRSVSAATITVIEHTADEQIPISVPIENQA